MGLRDMLVATMLTLTGEQVFKDAVAEMATLAFNNVGQCASQYQRPAAKVGASAWFGQVAADRLDTDTWKLLADERGIERQVAAAVQQPRRCRRW